MAIDFYLKAPGAQGASSLADFSELMYADETPESFRSITAAISSISRSLTGRRQARGSNRPKVGDSFQDSTGLIEELVR